MLLPLGVIGGNIMQLPILIYSHSYCTNSELKEKITFDYIIFDHWFDGKGFAVMFKAYFWFFTRGWYLSIPGIVLFSLTVLFLLCIEIGIYYSIFV